MSKRKFQYALEPVLLTRQWDLDAQLIELNKVNHDIAMLKDEQAKIEKHLARAMSEWKELSNASHHLSVDSFTVLTHYMNDLVKQRLAKEAEMTQLEQERDEMIDRVVAAQRGVDAVEQHKDRMKSDFVKLRLSGDFKIADDQWSTLQAGALHGDK